MKTASLRRTFRLVPAAALLFLTGLAAQHPADLTPAEKTELFIQHLAKVARVDPARRRALVLEYEIGSALGELADDAVDCPEGESPEEHARHHQRASGGSPLVPADFVERALGEVHPEYAEAARLRDAKNIEAATERARDLAGKGDPYLAAHANLLLAELELESAGADRTLLLGVLGRVERISARDRLYLVRDHRAAEIAASVFERLEKPLHELLQLAILLTDYPGLHSEAERRARERIAALEEKAGKPLGSIAGWMNQVEKLLAQELTGEEPTRASQTDIVSALDKLIELQEARERKSCSNCGGNCQGACKNGRPKGSRSRNPARVSALSTGKGEVLLHGVSHGDASSIWGQLRDKDASRALQGFKGKLPPRYERLLEQYYKNLSRNDPAASGGR